MEPSGQAWKSKEGELWISFTSALRSAGNRARWGWARGLAKLGEAKQKQIRCGDNHLPVGNRSPPRSRRYVVVFPFLPFQNSNPIFIVRHPRCKRCKRYSTHPRQSQQKHGGIVYGVGYTSFKSHCCIPPQSASLNIGTNGTVRLRGLGDSGFWTHVFGDAASFKLVPIDDLAEPADPVVQPAIGAVGCPSRI